MTRRSFLLSVCACFVLVAGLAPVAPSQLRYHDPSCSDLETSFVSIIDEIAKVTVRIDTDGGLGSGTLIRDDGLILTSAHVIEDEPVDRLRVTLSDGRRYKPQVLGINGAGDLALIQIQGRGLPVARFGDDGDLRVWEWVLASGHPASAFYDHQPAITCGVIHSLDGYIRAAGGRKVFRGAIQSDVPLSPGSSGGGLFDREGRLVGVNAAVTMGERRAYTVRISEYLTDKKRLLAGERFDRQLRRNRDYSVLKRRSSSRRRWFRRQLGTLAPVLSRRTVSLDVRGRTVKGIVVSERGDVLAPTQRLRTLSPGAIVPTTLDDGGIVRAELIAHDLMNHVTLLRLPEEEKGWLHFDLEEGLEARRGMLAVTAIGDEVTGGIVSGTHRSPPLDMTDLSYYRDVTQVDFRLYAGSVGCPTVDRTGSLIGMITQFRLVHHPERWMRDPYGAFVLPVSVLADSYRALKSGRGRPAPDWGFFGIELVELTESEKIRRGVVHGVLVGRDSLRNGPAIRSGLRPQDIITSIGGKPVGSEGAAVRHITAYRKGDRVPVGVIRNGVKKTITVSVGSRTLR